MARPWEVQVLALCGFGLAAEGLSDPRAAPLLHVPFEGHAEDTVSWMEAISLAAEHQRPPFGKSRGGRLWELGEQRWCRWLCTEQAWGTETTAGDPYSTTFPGHARWQKQVPTWQMLAFDPRPGSRERTRSGSCVPCWAACGLSSRTFTRWCSTTCTPRSPSCTWSRWRVSEPAVAWAGSCAPPGGVCLLSRVCLGESWAA